MEFKEEILNQEENIAFSLRELYHAYGYKPYKMSKFEPYDLYVQNRSFLIGSSMLTFTDTNGKLMALKPDVTLSIVKNYKDGQHKVYYNENVYREDGASHSFTEIMQAGLECIGNIDLYSQYEVLTLAAESLRRISPDYILDIASVGIVCGLMAATAADSSAKKWLLNYVRGKNAHNIHTLCQERGISEDISLVWEKLAALYGPACQLLPQLRPLCVNETMQTACDELEQLCRALENSGNVSLNLDFSIINDLNYYNGLVFKGYIQGIHSSVLSGGQYDNLLRRMGKRAGAIGFAVYLDQLKQLPCREALYDADVLLSYGPHTPARVVIEEAGQLRAQGLTVKVQPIFDCRGSYKRTIRL